MNWRSSGRGWFLFSSVGWLLHSLVEGASLPKAGAACWVLGARCWALGAGLWVLALSAQCWSLGSGFWVLGGAGSLGLGATRFWDSDLKCLHDHECEHGK